MKQLEVQEVFSLDSYSVIKAAYGDRKYYIAGTHDITEYVNEIVRQSGLEVVNKVVLELGLDLFKRRNPNKVVLNVAQFDLLLLDDKTTSAEYVREMVMDLFHFSPQKANEVVKELNSPAHSYKIGSFSEEMCITYCAMFDNGNQQLGQNIGYDWVPSANSPTSYEAALQTLETLIRRDYPNDI